MTETVCIIKNDVGWTIKATGGYDGFLKRDFADKEDMLAFVEYLWSV